MNTLIFTGCDLLENYYLCSINNSFWGNSIATEVVVICLKTTTFVVSTTVSQGNKKANIKL